MAIDAVDLALVNAIASPDSRGCPAVVSPADKIDGVDDVIFALAFKSLELLLGAGINNPRRTVGLILVVDNLVLHMIRDSVVIDVAVPTQKYARSVDSRKLWQLRRCKDRDPKL